MEWRKFPFKNNFSIKSGIKNYFPGARIFYCGFFLICPVLQPPILKGLLYKTPKNLPFFFPEKIQTQIFRDYIKKNAQVDQYPQEKRTNPPSPKN